MENTLGFYYMVFQPETSRQRVKCWLDGEKYHRYFKMDEILAMVDRELQPAFRKAFMEASFFLWGVDERALGRLSYRGEEPPITQWIREKKTENKKELPSDQTHDQFWSAEAYFDGMGAVQIVKP